MKLSVVIMIAGLILALTPSAMAHHGEAGLYDETRVIEVRGTVTAWRFVNPHPILRVEVTGEGSEKVQWNVAFGPAAASALRRRGFSPETFKPGDVLILKGHPAVATGAHGLTIRGEGSGVTRDDGTPVP
jgi:hypothetical protein